MDSTGIWNNTILNFLSTKNQHEACKWLENLSSFLQFSAVFQLRLRLISQQKSITFLIIIYLIH